MTQLMQGKRGLIMGVANDHSIAWGIAQALHAEGAEVGQRIRRQIKQDRRLADIAPLFALNVRGVEDVDDEAAFDRVRPQPQVDIAERGGVRSGRCGQQ